MSPALPRVLCWPPNAVTISRVLLVGGLVTALLAGMEVPKFLRIFVVVYGYWLSDHLDGWLARWTKTSSAFGEYLDLAADRFCDLALAVWVIHSCPSLLWFTLVFLLTRVSFDVVLKRVIESWSLIAAKLPRLGLLQETSVHDIVATLFHLIRSTYFLFALLGSPQRVLGYLLCVGCVFYTSTIVLKFEALAIAAEAKRAGESVRY